jgi:solute carrier family 35 protein E3
MVATTTLSTWSNGGATLQQPLLDVEQLEPQSLKESKTWAAASWSGINLLTSILIVFVNKIIFDGYGFRFPMTLCTIHTLLTAVGLRLFVACPTGIKEKAMPLSSKAYMGACYAAFVCTSVLSIQLNPVGIYQVTRTMTTPSIVLFELFLYTKIPSLRVRASLVALVAGVTLCTVSEYGMDGASAAGLTVAMASALVSAWQQILAGVLQKQHNINGMQLLHQCTPTAALLLAMVAPVVDDIGSFTAAQPNDHTLLGYQHTWASTSVIIGSGVLGLTVMLSAFQMIGLTSALTYNVLGYSKTIIIVAGGWLWFHESMSALKAAGVGLAIVGLACYSLAKYSEAQQQQEEEEQCKPQAIKG